MTINLTHYPQFGILPNFYFFITINERLMETIFYGETYYEATFANTFGTGTG